MILSIRNCDKHFTTDSIDLYPELFTLILDQQCWGMLFALKI